MSVTIKSAREIELMRTAGKLLEEVHNELAAFVKPGISTLDIDRLGEKLIRERGCIPNFLNYNGYPASICVSVNDEVVHGIPHAEHILQEGDIVILDSNWKFPPFTPETNSPADKRLFINAETAIWMRDHKVKCVGFGDGVSIENCEADVKPFHDIIMAYDGVFLEVLKNLEYLKSDTFFMSYSALPIIGADSCPVRAYAIEGLPGFSA